jgi:hypothetical protein
LTNDYPANVARRSPAGRQPSRRRTRPSRMELGQQRLHPDRQSAGVLVGALRPRRQRHFRSRAKSLHRARSGLPARPA